MAATFPIITQRVEESGIRSSIEVKRIQQLLARTGHHPKNKLDGVWGKTSVEAWIAYQKGQGWLPNNYLDPTDAEDRLGWLAYEAGVLMWIPEGLRSLSAVTTVTDTCIVAGIPYGWSGHSGGTKMIWGFEKHKWAVIFTKPGSQKTAEFDVDSAEPRALNCCSFANLLLSIWSRGDAHGHPYSSSQAVGGDGIQVGERYGMPEVLNKSGEKVFHSLEDLQRVLQPDRIYHFALCRDETGLFTKHDTIIIGGNVYQANIPAASPNRGAVYVKPLERQWKRMKVKRARLFGPGPH